jgi:hypothetical protein
MAAINFPDSPVLNEEFQSGNTTWKWDGTVWLKVADSVTADSLLRLSGSTIYPYDFGTENFSTTQSILIGSGSGYGTTYARNSIFLGTEAGYSASFFDKENENPEFAGYLYAIGYQAGSGSDNSDNTIMIGTRAGIHTNQSYQSIMIGNDAGSLSGSKQYSIVMGNSAAQNSNLQDTIAIGRVAAQTLDYTNEDWPIEWENEPINYTDSVIIGTSAGKMAKSSGDSTFIGYNAGRNSYESSNSVFVGFNAGTDANNSEGSTFIGASTGQVSFNSSYSTFIGTATGNDANNSGGSTFIGHAAGIGAYSSSLSTYIGYGAGAYIQDSEIIKPSTVNNIVIGTLIGLPYDSSNAINIGGLIFGTGSFSEYSEEIYSGSANGRIGINQPTPQKELDISGSIRVSQLSTSLTAPVTSGTTKMVITDSNGDLSFTDISGGNAFPYTGSAQITGSLTITGSLIVSQSLFQYADNTDADIGTETVISIATGSYRAAFFDYVAVSGSNARAGTVTTVWNGASIEYTEASTTDIGNTTNCNLQTVLSSGNVVLQSRMLSDNWSVKALARLL